MKHKLDVEINLYQEKNKKVIFLGETIKGFLKIRPHEDLNVQEFGFQLVKVVTSEKEEIISTHSICSNDVLSQHEIYRFPINFINKEHESFKGKKLDITFKMKPYLITKENGNIKDKTKEYSINFIEKESIWTTVSYLNFYAEQSKYTITPQETILNHNSCFAIFLYTFLFGYFLCFTVSFAMKQESSLNNKVLIIYLIGLAITLFFNQYISKHVLGKIHLKIEETDDEYFTIHIKKDKKWRSIHRITAFFQIEEVNYGTRKSNERNTHTHYESKVYKVNPPYDNLALSFKYPKAAPTPLKIKAFRINWSLKLELATTFGFNYKFNWDFIVDKQY